MIGVRLHANYLHISIPIPERRNILTVQYAYIDVCINWLYCIPILTFPSLHYKLYRVTGYYSRTTNIELPVHVSSV